MHSVVTGGALGPDGSRWIRARAGFLFPVRALSKTFRGTYLAALRRAFEGGELHLTGSLARLTDPAAFTDWQRRWLLVVMFAERGAATRLISARKATLSD